MRNLLDRIARKLGYLPASKVMKHFGPHQRPDIHQPISCDDAQMLLNGQLHQERFADNIWRQSIAAAAGRKLPAIYDLLAAAYKGDEAAYGQIVKACMGLPTIYFADNKAVVRITDTIEVTFDSAIRNDAGTLSHLPGHVTVMRTDTRDSITFLLGSPVNFSFVMDDVPAKLRTLLTPANV